MKKKTIDTSLAFVFAGLVFMGIVLMSSVSVYESYELTERILEVPNNSYYFWGHLKRVFMAIPIFLAGLYLPLKFWKRFALPLFFLTWLLLIVVFIPGADGVPADQVSGFTAKSWINLPFLPSIQPSEIMKMMLIFYLAVWMEKRQELVQSFQYGFLPFTVLISMVIVLLVLQPDYGTGLVTLTIAGAMFFSAGGSLAHISIGTLVAGLIALPVILLTARSSHVIERFQVFFDPSIDSQGIGYQLYQSLMAVGNGGFFGVGFGKSIQKFGYLPEVYADTIFAAVAEELGFIRVIVLVGAYAFVAYKGYKIALNAKDRFSMLVAVGISSWFVFQAFINIMGIIGIFPLTGITLPFISYGGTSMMATMLGAGILLNISRSAHGATHFTGRRRVGRAHRAPLRRRRYT